MNEKKPLSPQDAKSRRQNLAHLAAEYGNIDSIPDELVVKRGEGPDGGEPCIILRDATRVTNQDLKIALEEGLKDPNLVAELEALKPGKKSAQGEKPKP